MSLIFRECGVYFIFGLECRICFIFDAWNVRFYVSDFIQTSTERVAIIYVFVSGFRIFSADSNAFILSSQRSFRSINL